MFDIKEFRIEFNQTILVLLQSVLVILQALAIFFCFFCERCKH